MDRLRPIEMMVRVTEAGSFAKAAQALDLTPSAISHAIAQLEKSLRVTLFYRTTRALKLTDSGEEFYRRGKEILDKLGEAESHLSRTPAGLSGTLHVGMPTAISRDIVMPRLSVFVKRHPDLKLECRMMKQVAEMHAAGFDLLLRVGEPPDCALVAHKLADVRSALYAAPEYLKVAGEPRDPSDLARHRCLVFKPNWSVKPLDEWRFERNGVRKTIKVPAALTTDDRDGLIAAALAGSGIVRSGMFDPAPIATGQLKRVLSSWTCLDAPPVYALYRKGQRTVPKVAAFLEFVAEAFAAFDPEELTLIHTSGIKRDGKVIAR